MFQTNTCPEASYLGCRPCWRHWNAFELPWGSLLRCWEVASHCIWLRMLLCTHRVSRESRADLIGFIGFIMEVVSKGTKVCNPWEPRVNFKLWEYIVWVLNKNFACKGLLCMYLRNDRAVLIMVWISPIWDSYLLDCQRQPTFRPRSDLGRIRKFEPIST